MYGNISYMPDDSVKIPEIPGDSIIIPGDSIPPIIDDSIKIPEIPGDSIIIPGDSIPPIIDDSVKIPEIPGDSITIPGDITEPGRVITDVSVEELDKDQVYTSNGKLCVVLKEPEKVSIYSVYTGKSFVFQLSTGVNELTLPKGIYIIKGKKVLL